MGSAENRTAVGAGGACISTGVVVEVVHARVLWVAVVAQDVRFDCCDKAVHILLVCIHAIERLGLSGAEVGRTEQVYEGQSSGVLAPDSSNGFRLYCNMKLNLSNLTLIATMTEFN